MSINLCLCGAQAGYPHRPGCPYPQYNASQAQSEKWQRALESRHHPGNRRSTRVTPGTILRLFEDIDLLDRGVILKGSLVQVVHDAGEYLLVETFDRSLCFPVIKNQGIIQPLEGVLSVWHREELLYWSLDQQPPSAQVLVWPDQYELVAQVAAISLEAAYRATQHIDHEWWLNPNVQLHKHSRSTSCGDMIAIDADHLMVVTPIGFRWLVTEKPGGPTEKPPPNQPNPIKGANHEYR